ncbi:unnamed protein product [Moneuplotes crassus]|uniref:RING-type domain-containing protein n=1 Tax=Euplotes crassus TaxID=5936 RepID=A0AAD2D436_EUPCR|nr:unnamed protein product [Moneuplotes crassus]
MCDHNCGTIIFIVIFAVVIGFFDEDNDMNESILYHPFVQPVYILIVICYFIFKRRFGQEMFVILIMSAYFLLLSTVFNLITFNEVLAQDLGNKGYLEVYFWAVQAISVAILVRFIFLIIQECRGNRTEEFHPGLQYDAKNYFDQIPSIIYQPFTSLKSDECAICLTKYEQDDTIKVMPVCFHTFHSQCIKAWFDNNSTCPFCRRDFTRQDIQQCESMSEDEIYRCIKSSDVRPSLFNNPQRTDPRASLNTPYDPNFIR